MSERARRNDASSDIDVELIALESVPDAPSREEIELLCALAAAAVGVSDGHLAIALVSPERIAELNAVHRGRPAPTDVLSFPIDGADPLGGEVERELGDIVICPEHTVDLREAIVHGVLHLLGMDHETDSGEMLALQAQILASKPVAASSGQPSSAVSGAPSSALSGASGGPHSGGRR